MEPTPDLTPEFMQLLLPELARESAKIPAPRSYRHHNRHWRNLKAIKQQRRII
ncbi:hypothetical protein ACLB1T_19115 [Escherichia coli]